MLLLTWNMHKGKSSAGFPSAKKALTEILHFSPDILLLQEAPMQKTEDEERFWRVLRDEYPHSFFEQVHKRPHRMAIMSKHEIEDSLTHNVSTHFTDQRLLLHVRLKKLDIKIVCAHFGLTRYARGIQQGELSKIIKEDRKVIVAGDLNDWRKEMVPCEGLSCLGHSKTYPAKMPFLSLDRIWIKGVNSGDMWIPNGRWRECSDHLPLALEIDCGG